MTKKKKLIVIIIFAVPLILIAIYFRFYFTVKNIAHAEKSINPIATDYFAHATVVSLATLAMHNYLFVDYDSIFMKPMYWLEDAFFKVGHKHIESHNLGEEGVWWFLIYAPKYGIVQPGRRDFSLAIDSLPRDQSIQLRDRIYKYFLAITSDGVKGVDFGKYTSSAVHGMFSAPFSNAGRLYPGKTREKQLDNFWNDKLFFIKEIHSYEKYKHYLNHDQYIKLHKNTYINIVGRLNSIIYFEILQKNTSDICGSFLDDYLNILSRSDLNFGDLSSKRLKVIKIILNRTGNFCPEKKMTINSTKIMLEKRRRN